MILLFMLFLKSANKLVGWNSVSVQEGEDRAE